MQRQATTVEDTTPVSHPDVATPTYVTLAEAAQLVQVSARTIRRRVADGSLPGYKAGDAPRTRPCGSGSTSWSAGLEDEA